MALTKETEQKIEILADNQIQVRDTTIILEDGVELSRTHHRHVLAVGADVSAESQRVRDIAASVWV